MGKVVQEFGTFVEEGSIVFVPFQDEIFSLPQLKAAAEIFCDTTDQE